MKRYQDYMDGITVSDTLHEKLKHLRTKKRPALWKKYGAMAAALVLVLGLGAWGLGGNLELGGPDPELGQTDRPTQPSGSQDEIAILGTYEVLEGGKLVQYSLPVIRYGQVDDVAMKDMALPEGVTRRDLTAEELEALLGGRENIANHLNWAEYELHGYAKVYEDGTLFLLGISGNKGTEGLDHFFLELMPGQIPPSCIVYPESKVNLLGDVEVTADIYYGQRAASARTSFLYGDYGYRFSLNTTDPGELEEMVARAVRYILADGLRIVAPGGGTELNTSSYDPAP